ncbi:IMPACT family protein [Rhodococcus sp. SGAir0479]|uniref:IMPACT family protein n=1 Tax=Rhodococcus sp. SGAir0479 TaxID=2567884 RepID=UPI0010CD6385|nr:YigZ family protein [Rhodococcus sp. SGAir0479]QCQ90053.1 YigZ family protein [Rhodococcus sp. SGAir0479]
MPSTLSPGADVVVETEIKHSRFIAALRRVDTPADAQAFLDEQRRGYPDARHHCWAYVTGDEPTERAERSGDDGEPGGTAGVPMLQVLRARQLVDVAAVVTRYFGGIKLGAGGLVRAYSGAVAAAVDAAASQSRLLGRERLDLLTVDVGHDIAGRVDAELRGRGVLVVDTAYAAEVTFTLATKDPDALAAIVAELTAGAGRLEPAGVRWVDV